MTPMKLGVLGLAARVAFWWASVLRGRKLASEQAQRLIDTATAALPELRPRLEAVHTTLRNEVPLPRWCEIIVFSANRAGDEAEADLRSAIEDIRALLRKNKPHEAAAIDIPFILERHAAAVEEIGQARQQLLALRAQAPVAAARTEQAVREATATLQSYEQEGWRLRTSGLELADLAPRASLLSTRAQRPDEEHIAVIEESGRIAAQAAAVVEQVRKHISNEHSKGRYPVPPHPLFNLVRTQDVIVHEGRVHLVDGGTVHDGPALAALDQLHRQRNAEWASQRMQKYVQAELKASTGQTLSETERRVQFALTEVFPHCRIAGEALPASETGSSEDALAEILSARIAALRKESARNAPGRITADECKEFVPGDLVRLTGEARKHNYDYTKVGSEGVIVGQASPRKYRVRFTLITGKRWRERHGDTWEVHADCLERVAPGGSTAERAIGTGSILIRRGGTIAVLIPAESGALSLYGKQFQVHEAESTVEGLADIMDYWIRQDLRLEALQDALEAGDTGTSDDVIYAKAIAARGRYAEGDHRLEVSGDAVWIYLRVPPFALKERNRDIHHAFPEMEVATPIKRNGQGFTCEEPRMMSGNIHPFARPNQAICTAGMKPQGTTSSGEYVAAYLFLARDVLRTAYRPSSHNPQTGWMEDSAVHQQTILPKEELRRRNIPVTNVTPAPGDDDAIGNPQATAEAGGQGCARDTGLPDDTYI